MNIIVKGTVPSGTDTSGVFGPPNTNLAGQSFTVMFLFNRGLGTQYDKRRRLRQDDLRFQRRR